MQFVAAIFILYGGWLIFDGRKAYLSPAFAVSQAPQEFKSATFTKNVAPYNNPYNLYLEFKSCRYARGTGLFRACSYHLIQESISWKDGIRMWGPYLLLFLGLAIIFGRFTCGWICPIGFIQDILQRIRKKTGIRSLKIPEKAAKIAKYSAMVFFFAIVPALSFAVTIKSLPWEIRDGLYLAGCQVCPARVISALLTGYPVTLDLFRPVFVYFFIICLLLTAVVAGSLFVNRFWCRICPNGIMLSFFNTGKVLAKKKDLLKCNRCGVCANNCTMDTAFVYNEKKRETVDHPNCINCFKCVESCPEKAVKVKFFGKRIF